MTKDKQNPKSLSVRTRNIALENEENSPEVLKAKLRILEIVAAMLPPLQGRAGRPRNRQKALKNIAYYYGQRK
jgi:hypothetical protein